MHKCCICQLEITDKDFNYQNINGKIFYTHNKCERDVEDIFDSIQDVDETPSLVFINEDIEVGESDIKDSENI